MAEPLAASSGPAAPERAALLATKLHKPRPRPGFVPRPRLAERLDDGLAHGLVLVCAPAGYGKTTLLADLVQRAEHPVAWLCLDPVDNDPARFWRHVVAALDGVCPGIGERVAPLLGPPAPSSYRGLVTALINELADRPGGDQALLVLDDYHLIDAGPVHESLAFLLEYRPPGLSVVLTSRSDPPLALSRLRAGGQLAELRAAELRFTPAEAAALLRQARRPGGPAGRCPMRWWRRWRPGPRAGRPGCSWRPCRCAASPTSRGSCRRSPAATVSSWISWPRRCSSSKASRYARSCWRPRCWSVSAATCATRSPAAPGASHCWSRWSGPDCSWCRWMRYAAGGVTTTCSPTCSASACSRSSPAGWLCLHRSAATWCQEHGLPDDAVRHAVAAGEMTWAARLIEQYFDELYYLSGEGTTLQRWLSALPDDLARSRPRLLLAQAQLTMVSGRVEAMEPLLDAAERAAPGAAREAFEPTVGRAGSMLVNVPALIAIRRAFLALLRGDAENGAAFASRALAESSEGEWLLSSTARGFLAMAEWLGGRLAEAVRAFASSTAGWQAAGQPALTAWHRVQLAQVQRALGRLDAAIQTYEQALEAIATPGRPPPPTAGPVYVGLAEVAYQRNELDSALEYVTEGIALSRQFLYGASPAPGLVTLAWIRQATGDPDGALAAIGEAEHASPAPAGLLYPAPAQQARLLLAQGDVAAAARWTDESGLRAGDEPGYPREPGYLVLARVLLAQDRPAAALALLDRLHAAAAAQDRTGSLIEAGALRALALAACGRDADAVDALAEALTLACPQGYVRVFADEGPPMAALLGRLIAAQRAGQAAASVSLGYLARLRSAFGAEPAAPPAAVGTWPDRPADQPRARGAPDAGGRKVEPGHRRPARRHPRYRQEACQPHPGQARRG